MTSTTINRNKISASIQDYLTWEQSSFFVVVSKAISTLNSFLLIV